MTSSGRRHHAGPGLKSLYFTHMTQGLQTTLPYVVSVYMVRQWGEREKIPPSEEAVGIRTGSLGAAFCAAQFLTSYLLGRLSDHIGRKPIIVIGNISCVLGVLAFGFSANYFQAVVARVGAGLFNGIIGAEKATIGDSLSADGQAKAMSIISLMWGIGTMCGPTIGGLLAAPCAEQGGVLHGSTIFCTHNSLLVSRPYLLPCVVASLLSVVATVLTVFFLEETLPSRRKTDAKEGYTAVSQAEEVELSSNTFKNEMQYCRDGQTDGDNSLTIEDSASSLEMGSNNVLNNNNGNEEEQEPWFRQSNVILALTGYSSIAFCYILLDELIPIFASAALDLGGLGLPTSELALPLAFGGAVLVVWALFFFPRLNARVGVIKCCRIGLYQTFPMALLIPMSSCFSARSPFLSSALLYIAMGCKAIAGTNAFTSSIILVNLVAPKGSLGAVNGVGQTAAAFVRALGPALGGMLWAWSLSLFKMLEWGPWGHQFLPFAFGAVVAICTLAVYYKVDLPAPELVNEE